MKRASSSSDSCRRHRVLPSSKTAPIRSSQPDGGTERTSQLPAARRHPRVPPTAQHAGLRKLSGDEKGHRWAWGWGGKWVLPTGHINPTPTGADTGGVSPSPVPRGWSPAAGTLRFTWLQTPAPSGHRKERRPREGPGRAALTECLEHLHAAELPLEEDGVVQGVERADHADEEHLEAT